MAQDTLFYKMNHFVLWEFFFVTSALTVDLNGDGIDDFFGGETLLLSNNGKLEDKSSIASVFFNDEVGGDLGALAHVANDVDNDGDPRYFLVCKKSAQIGATDILLIILNLSNVNK